MSDSQVLGDLLGQIPQDEQIDSLYTDGDTNTVDRYYQMTSMCGFPPRKNAKPWKDTKAHSLDRNELPCTVKSLGRTIWGKWSGYHQRSLVKTKMHCIKL